MQFFEFLLVNSFCFQSFTHPIPDEGLMITEYERSHAHNEELGLNDMKTENYGENDD
jgi:zinc finger protein